LQPLYNLLDREAEWDLIPVSRNEGVGVIPWSPLRGGWLSGRYRRDMAAPPSGSRVDADPDADGWPEAWPIYATDRTWDVVDAVVDVADKTGRTPAQVALRWLMQQSGVTAPIIGARTTDQLADNLAAADEPLADEHTQRLTEVSGRPVPYPFGLLDRFRRR
jgi:aryl-alcohol dehydrogenase-like predicted oxidoreductase